MRIGTNGCWGAEVSSLDHRRYGWRYFATTECFEDILSLAATCRRSRTIYKSLAEPAPAVAKC
jgi:hypothetical protein